jgi:4-amino-4-deoxy-L-arabinose transferase-like glycosyltransferase
MRPAWHLKAVLLSVAIILLALHWTRLHADPASKIALFHGVDHSSDLYTDEGLDSSGAIASARYGHWYLPGEFNLAVDAPMWSAMLHPLFRAAGVNLALARALQIAFFAASVFLLYLFVKQWRTGSDSVAAWSVLILSTNFLAFSFSRMAILESVWTFFVLASLVLATTACRRARLAYAYIAGICLACAVLTKLTALFFVLPLCAVFLLHRTRESRWLRLGIGLLSGAATLLLPYAYIVFTRFSADHHYYRQRNVVERAVHSPLGWIQSVAGIVASIRYFDLPLCLAFIVGLFFFLKHRRHLREEPLAVICGLWLIGDLLVSSSVGYFPPRYLLNPLFPFAALAALFAENAMRSSIIIGRVLYALLTIAVFLGVVEIGMQIAHPQYTLQAASDSIAAQLAEKKPSAVLMGDFAYGMSLYANIYPMDDGFGVAARSTRIATRNPSFFVTLGPASSDREADFAAAGRRLAFVRTYDALDNYFSGKQIYLYRVERGN